jgi:xanthine/uracil permease
MHLAAHQWQRNTALRWTGLSDAGLWYTVLPRISKVCGVTPNATRLSIRIPAIVLSEISVLVFSSSEVMRMRTLSIPPLTRDATPSNVLAATISILVESYRFLVTFLASP